MLLVSVILYLFHIFSNTNAAPLSVIANITIEQCTCPNQRTIWDIIWSCLVTIFSCCWVSVHPNMSGLDDSLIKKALQRLELMLWAIFAPELVIYWAAKQWLAARRLAKKYHGRPHITRAIDVHTLYCDCFFRARVDENPWIFYSDGWFHVIR